MGRRSMTYDLAWRWDGTWVWMFLGIYKVTINSVCVIQ